MQQATSTLCTQKIVAQAPSPGWAGALRPAGALQSLIDSVTTVPGLFSAPAKQDVAADVLLVFTLQLQGLRDRLQVCAGWGVQGSCGKRGNVQQGNKAQNLEC